MENPDCLYIYNRDFSIYGLPSKERYTIIVKDTWICPDEYLDTQDDDAYEIFYLSDWFNQVLNGKLIGWECACLNKKYIIKECVKLIMHTNPLQLRKDIDLMYKTYPDTQLTPFNCYEIIRNIKFTIQIIKNHKIVNYKEGLGIYHKLLNCQSESEMWDYVNDSYLDLAVLTNGMKKQEILNKINARNV